VRSSVMASLRVRDNALLYPKPRLVGAPGRRPRTATGRNRPAAVFLASANACFVTGQTLHVNGGSYLA